ncbi:MULTISPECIES: RluA family pseudouridine synthase [unclassified Neptuniibacter]|uniref:RluA family pseudouridine synthase n=1 Tax=unclassified Neptuniibacter TaxID=2630693 RepID=UPI0025FD49CA|nr:MULTISPECIES: RluA family pseudouridine synthase [unclassified Neptuniibacter]|tara:strand:+ start:26986 stop:27672 length:687 start_codon:yes stop_codon:yes gene_type:complete
MQPQADPFIVPICHEQIEVLYQDESLLLINKPSGLLSLSGKHPLNIDSVHYRLVKEYPTATLLHRLDFGTSGVMLVALNKAVNSALTKQFQAQSIRKTYTAILHGHLPKESGIIDAPIAKGDFPLQIISKEKGKQALTHYEVLAFDEAETEEGELELTTRVLFSPRSGRTHQLRIHSQFIGHPILGCDLYASDDAFFMAQRLMLHATSLTFTHPVSGERINFVVPCPF